MLFRPNRWWALRRGAFSVFYQRGQWVRLAGTIGSSSRCWIQRSNPPPDLNLRTTREFLRDQLGRVPQISWGDHILMPPAYFGCARTSNLFDSFQSRIPNNSAHCQSLYPRWTWGQRLLSSNRLCIKRGHDGDSSGICTSVER